jgi:hypothetical protein
MDEDAVSQQLIWDIISPCLLSYCISPTDELCRFFLLDFNINIWCHVCLVYKVVICLAYSPFVPERDERLARCR